MSKLQDGDEVAVYDETGRTSQLASFHGWDRRDDGWHAHLMVYGPRDLETGGGQYRDTVPAERVVPLIYCGRLPTGEIRHRCEGHNLMTDDLKVWA